MESSSRRLRPARRISGGRRRRPRPARGTWHVGDNGTYCVTIKWKTITENWCRYIFKVGDKHYGVRSIADGGAEAHEIEFSK